MPTFINNITLNSVFGNLYRSKHVLIVLIDPDGNYLLGSKPKFYPPGIYRLVGGGVEPNENSQEAAEREFTEELGMQPNPDKLQPLAKVITSGNYNSKLFTNTTYLFKYQLDAEEELQAGDDIEELIECSPHKLKELIDNYQQLAPNNWLIENGQKVHSWHDYGQMYSFIHQVALDLTN